MVVDGVAAVMIAQFLIPPNLPSVLLNIFAVNSAHLNTIFHYHNQFRQFLLHNE